MSILGVVGPCRESHWLLSLQPNLGHQTLYLRSEKENSRYQIAVTLHCTYFPWGKIILELSKGILGQLNFHLRYAYLGRRFPTFPQSSDVIENLCMEFLVQLFPLIGCVNSQLRNNVSNAKMDPPCQIPRFPASTSWLEHD